MNTWRRLIRNWPWKLGAVLVSTVLWFFMVGEPELVTIEAVPLAFHHLPDGILLSSDPPDFVRLELRGPSREIQRQNLTGIKVLVDLAGVQQAGEQTFTISEADIALPAGVQFLRAVPAQLRLGFDRMASRNLPVKVQFSGRPADGWSVERVDVQPPEVAVRGPASRVSSLEGALTDAVNLTGRSAAFETRVNAYLEDPRVELHSAAVVAVRITLKKTHEIN